MRPINFTVDAALLRELGARLIGRSYIALAELVKNSYDADAANCRIEFMDDQITVSDDGHGMTSEEFQECWMRVGTTHKTKKAVSRHFQRPLTGSKGIGRLSVQFLADELALESSSQSDPSRYLYAIVDWTTIDAAKDLNTVAVLWEMRTGRPHYPNGAPTGTRVVLRNLRSTWSADDIEKLGQDVWILQSPFDRPRVATPAPPVSTARDFYVDVDAPGIAQAKNRFNRLHDALFRNWRARIRGSLERGRSGENAAISVRFKTGYPDGLARDTDFREVVNLPVTVTDRDTASSSETSAIDRSTFEILVFKTEGRQAEGVTVGDMRDYLRTFGNVSIYDAGFRLPYYGSTQDWLGIAEDQGRRLVTSTLLPSRLKIDSRYLLDLPAPGRIFGAVRIDTNHERIAALAFSPPNEHLQIQPGRDRLTDNTAFRQLRDLVRFSLDYYANRFRFLSLQALETRHAKEPPSRSFNRAVDSLDRHKAHIPPDVYREVRGSVLAGAKAAKAAEQDLDQRAVLLAPLATAGITAVAMNHELAREIRLLERTAEQLREIATSPGLARLLPVAESLDATRRRLRSLQALFSPLTVTEDRTATARLLVHPIVCQVVDAMTPLMPGVTFHLDGVPQGLRFPLGSFAEWNAILQNLLSNAWNALLDSDRLSIAFDGGRGNRLREWLRISDTGVGLGVALEDSAQLFYPFERRLQISPENRSIAMGGQGLGLAIVRMIAQRRAARASFVPAKDGFATTVEISWKGAAE